MDQQFSFIIKAETDKFENRYIMKAECACGGRFQIISMEEFQEGDALYNEVKTMCRKCNGLDSFIFDITKREREKTKKKPGKTYHLNPATIAEELEKEPSSREFNFFSKIASNIEEAYGSSHNFSEKQFGIEKRELKTGEPPVKPSVSDRLDKLKNDFRQLKSKYSNEKQFEIEKKELKAEDPPVKPPETSGMEELKNDFRQLKLRYSQASLKIKFLEEENKLMQLLEEKLSKQEIESQKRHRTIEKLKKELEDKDSEIKRLKEVITVKEHDIEAYKKLIEDKRTPGWMKLLGG